VRAALESTRAIKLPINEPPSVLPLVEKLLARDLVFLVAV